MNTTERYEVRILHYKLIIKKKILYKLLSTVLLNNSRVNMSEMILNIKIQDIHVKIPFELLALPLRFLCALSEISKRKEKEKCKFS